MVTLDSTKNTIVSTYLSDIPSHPSLKLNLELTF